MPREHWERRWPVGLHICESEKDKVLTMGYKTLQDLESIHSLTSSPIVCSFSPQGHPSCSQTLQHIPCQSVCTAAPFAWNVLYTYPHVSFLNFFFLFFWALFKCQGDDFDSDDSDFFLTTLL